MPCRVLLPGLGKLGGVLPFDIDVGQLVLWVTVLSLVMALAAVIALPWVVTRLPQDYFTRPNRAAWRKTGEPPEPPFALILGLLKNVLGGALLLVGIVLLFMPGQGLLTIVAGLMLMNFPGKYKLERWLVQRPGVFKGLNWMRERAGYAPFDSVNGPLSGQGDA